MSRGVNAEAPGRCGLCFEEEVANGQCQNCGAQTVPCESLPPLELSAQKES